MSSEAVVRESASGDPPRGKAARTRLRLVESVREEIEAEGNFSPDSVARRAASSPATFYNHFASKDEAVLAAFEAVMGELVEFVQQGLDVARALDEGLEAFLHDWTWTCIGFFRANNLLFSAARSRMSSRDDFRVVYLAREAEALEAYTRFVRLGQRAGLIREAEPEALAEVFLLTSEGWGHPRLRRATRGDALHEELVRSLHAMLAPGERESN